MIIKFYKALIKYIKYIKYYIIFKEKINVFGNFKVDNPNNVKFGKNCTVNDNVYIIGENKVLIGNNVIISAGVKIIDTGLDYRNSNEHGSHIKSNIRIGNYVWIGAGSIILPNGT